jgi:hypothetical protein
LDRASGQRPTGHRLRSQSQVPPPSWSVTSTTDVYIRRIPVVPAQSLERLATFGQAGPPALLAHFQSDGGGQTGHRTDTMSGAIRAEVCKPLTVSSNGNNTLFSLARSPHHVSPGRRENASAQQTRAAAGRVRSGAGLGNITCSAPGKRLRRARTPWVVGWAAPPCGSSSRQRSR